MVFCYTRRSVPCSACIRGVLLQEMGRKTATARHHAEEGLGMLIPKWDVSIKSLSSELRERQGTGSRKSVRARGVRGHQRHRPSITSSKAHVNSESAEYVQGCAKASLLMLWLPVQCSHGIPEVQTSGTLTLCLLSDSFPSVSLPHPTWM